MRIEVNVPTPVVLAAFVATGPLAVYAAFKLKAKPEYEDADEDFTATCWSERFLISIAVPPFGWMTLATPAISCASKFIAKTVFRSK
jgi:hypothetical protein